MKKWQAEVNGAAVERTTSCLLVYWLKSFRTSSAYATSTFWIVCNLQNIIRQSYGPITIAIRARFEHDSATRCYEMRTIRARFEHDIQHPTRSYVRLSHNNANVTIDLRRTSNLRNILRRTRYFSLARFTCKTVRSSEIVFVINLTIFLREIVARCKSPS